MSIDHKTNRSSNTAGVSPGDQQVVLLVSPGGGKSSHGGDVNPFVFLRVVWRQRIFILGVTSFFILLSVVYALTATRWYITEVVISPVAAKAPQGLSNQMGGLSGLASLAGISISGGTSSESLAVLRSRDFIRAFIEDENLLPVLFAQKKWSAALRQWLSIEEKDIPDLRDGVKLFGETLMSVQEDKKTGLVTLSVQWTNPNLAAEWANSLVRRANEILRHRALFEAETNVRYLQKELSLATLVPMQQSISRLLENEQQKLMLAKGNEEFAFRIIDRAQVPKWPSKPRRLQIVFLVGIAGGALSIFAVLMHHASKRWQDIYQSNDDDRGADSRAI